MNQTEIMEKITTIFRNLFNNKNIILSYATTAKDIHGWDSFNHINLMMMVEEEFNIRMRNSEITHLKNVGELVELIMAKKR